MIKVKLHYKLIIFGVLFISNLYAQKPLIQNITVAHTDSSLYLLNTISDSLGWDMEIEKRNLFNKASDFSVKLNINKLYNGKFNPHEFNYQIHQCKNNIVLIFYSNIGNNKIAIGKLISYSGNVSEAFVLDKTENINNTISKSLYYSTLTSMGDILLTVRKTFFSGFQRDKCILYDDIFNKIWGYDFPKINTQTDLNIISDVDLNKNLIYFIANYEKDLFFETSPNMDSITKIKIGFSKYDIKVRRDSLEIFLVSPTLNKINRTKVYYPFGPLPILKGLTNSNILLYNIVDIDDEKFILPAKKGYYLKRIDLNINSVELDTFVVLSEEIQKALTYTFEGQTNRPTNKYFRLIFEKIFDGNLYTTYEHGFIDLKFEIIITKYNINDNKLNWVKFIPKKTDFSSINTNALTFSYYNKKFNITYFENKKNQNKEYEFRNYKTCNNIENSNYIYYTIDNNGNENKSIINLNDLNYLFPWHSDKNLNNTKSFGFFGRNYFNYSIINRTNK